MEIFSVESLSFSYPDAEKTALSDVSFKINRGEFVVLCGKSGCGKTTLLRLLKPELSPFGDKNGRVLFMGNDIDALSTRDSAQKIGFVMQNPDSQVVTDRVMQELAFGLESLGCDSEEIRRKIAEISNFFGIDSFITSETSQLSGGQKQLLGLASVMVMNPEVIILDEPSSQLDPISTDSFFSILRRINEHFGTTVILCEHRLEECFAMADKVICLEDGYVKFVESPKKASEMLFKTDMRKALPSAVRIFGDKANEVEMPITVKEGRAFLREKFKDSVAKITPYENQNCNAIELKDVWFRYEKSAPDILKGLDFSVRQGDIVCVLGSNGTGKSTLLKVISKLAKPYKCKAKILDKPISSYKSNSLYNGVISVLFQDARTVFTADTVIENYRQSCKAFNLDSDKTIKNISELLSIGHLLERHPLDLSGGELQKCALGRVLISDPKILLLDEPTKGIDAFSKAEIGKLLKELSSRGMTIVVVTHDVEFSAEYADMCCMLFDGQIVSTAPPVQFFSANNFYTTPACTIAKGVIKNAVTVSAVRGCLSEVSKP